MERREEGRKGDKEENKEEGRERGMLWRDSKACYEFTQFSLWRE